MTIDELRKIPFRWISHLATEHEHCATYANEEYGIACCVHTPFKDGEPYGRCRTHYLYRFKVYKSTRAFLAAYNKEETHYIDEHKSKRQ